MFENELKILAEIAGPFLGVDFGSKRVGLSVSDALGISVKPLPALDRSKIKKRGESVEGEVVKLCKEFAIRGIIVGIPFKLDGSRSEQTEKALTFCRRLALRSEIPVVGIDEIFSSQEAHEILTAGKNPDSRSGRAKSSKSGAIDSVSASIILERFLSSRSEIV